MKPRRHALSNEADKTGLGCLIEVLFRHLAACGTARVICWKPSKLEKVASSVMVGRAVTRSGSDSLDADIPQARRWRDSVFFQIP